MIGFVTPICKSCQNTTLERSRIIGGPIKIIERAIAFRFFAQNLGVEVLCKVCITLSFHKAGRDRYAKFPDLIADDGYVRLLFVDEERALAPEETPRVIVQGPSTLGDLIKIKTRSRLGLAQLKRFAPDQTDRGLKKSRFFYKHVLVRPWLWPAAAVYLYVNLRSRARAAKQLGTIEHYEWERDDPARQAAAAAN